MSKFQLVIYTESGAKVKELPHVGVYWMAKKEAQEELDNSSSVLPIHKIDIVCDGVRKETLIKPSPKVNPLSDAYQFLGFGPKGPKTAEYYTCDAFNQTVQNHSELFEFFEDGELNKIRRLSDNKIYWWDIHRNDRKVMMVVVQPC